MLIWRQHPWNMAQRRNKSDLQVKKQHVYWKLFTFYKLLNKNRKQKEDNSTLIHFVFAFDSVQTCSVFRAFDSSRNDSKCPPFLKIYKVIKNWHYSSGGVVR